MSLDDKLRGLAEQQHGTFSSGQASDVGATHGALQQRVRNGMLDRLGPRVYRLAGAPVTPELRRFAAWLDAGGFAAISHETAGAHWRLPGCAADPVHVSRLRDGTFPPGSLGLVHTTRVLLGTHVCETDGLLITTPTRTLFDLAATAAPGRVERLLDWAWSHRLTSGRLLRRTLRELEGRGRAGIQIMRELIEARGPDYVPPASGQESRFIQILADDGQAPMDRQVDLGGETWIGRVDFVDLDAKVIVEIQSELHHTSLSDQRSDRERRRRLEEAGWIVIEITQFELWHRPREVAAQVRTARSRARTGR